ncbi:BMP family ABC transporter substrate-binding protein [Bradyrhizobium neotropicale]|uniref:BMP family ABC transporter substrate-binding protein n=1 Tax=Bradyrhizobium neotropicale TaxID=1497615 RepID=UPI001AD632F3|nr:BMP family ABC transporter substrate-binding protein [Bradyrhizobium neotropicale]
MWSMATAVGLAIAAPVAAPAAEPLKVAFVYLGPRSDGGWTQQHDLARLALEKAMGSAIKTTFVENVPETADSERVFRQLAADGNKLIFATSFGYMEPLQKVAKLFPDVKFEHVNGFKTAANITVYEPRFEEGFYLIGTIAGLMTKTNTLGFIGSFPIPSVMRNINAMALGAQAVNPKIKVKPIWVNTWYDPGKERQAADTLIAQGADNVAQNTDSPASIQAAQEKGTYAFSIDADMSSFGKKAQLSGSTEDWSGYYIDETKKVLDGTWTGNRRIRWGLKEGLVVMAPLNPDIPPDVVKVFEEKKAAIIAGTLNPFAGPIKDNTGKEMVPAGGKMSEATFSSLNWYVEGVEGTVPK